MIVLIIIVLGGLVCIIIGIVRGIVQYVTVPKPPKGLSYREYRHYYSTYSADEEEEEEDVHKQERIDLLDETIIKYNRLLDSLADQYKDTYNDKTRSAILAKQIATMEKLNRALEKREKLES